MEEVPLFVHPQLYFFHRIGPKVISQSCGRISFLRVFIFVALLLTPSIALTQSIGVGTSFVRTSAPDPDPTRTKDGGANLAAINVEANAPLPLNLEMRLLASYGFAAELPTIFTRDEGASRKAIAEIRLRPELRLYLNRSGFVQAFVAGGVEYYRQRFVGTEPAPSPLPDPLPPVAYIESHEARLPASGLNPLLTFGARLGEYSEASYSRIFQDQTILNASGLQGHRIAYSFTREISKRLSLKVAAEADYVRYREAAGFDPIFADNYGERDLIYRVRVMLMLGGGK